LELAAARLKIG